MVSRCIRVPKAEGEKVRNELLDKGILDVGARIGSDGEYLLMPILSDHFEDYPSEDVDLKVQGHRETDYRNLLDMPSDLKDQLPNSFDVIGDVLLIRLNDGLIPFKEDIGKAIIEVTPNIRVVMLDSGVKGDFRIRQLEFMAGVGSSETIHKEFGVRMLVDPAKVYFNPRLSTERSRVAGLVEEGEVIIDMFAGVAPFGTVICKLAKPKRVYSIDLNPDAESFAKRNAELNHITNLQPITGDATEEVYRLPDADRIIMNLPHMADVFLIHALHKLRPGGVVHMHRILERTELEGFISDLVSRMAESGFKISVGRVCEMKTYSPTMSVYVFDISSDPISSS